MKAEQRQQQEEDLSRSSFIIRDTKSNEKASGKQKDDEA